MINVSSSMLSANSNIQQSLAIIVYNPLLEPIEFIKSEFLKIAELQTESKQHTFSYGQEGMTYIESSFATIGAYYSPSTYYCSSFQTEWALRQGSAIVMPSSEIDDSPSQTEWTLSNGQKTKNFIDWALDDTKHYFKKQSINDKLILDNFIKNNRNFIDKRALLNVLTYIQFKETSDNISVQRHEEVLKETILSDLKTRSDQYLDPTYSPLPLSYKDLLAYLKEHTYYPDLD